MNFRRYPLIVATLAALALAACGGAWTDSKKVDYRSAGKTAPLEVPPDLTAPTQDDRYAVPASGPARGTATYSAYDRDRSAKGQGTGGEQILPGADKVTVQRAGNQRWLVVQATPEQVWPVVREFWTELGFIVNVENPSTGIMETDWAENRAKIAQDPIRNLFGKFLDQVYSTGERDKFRTRLERGGQPGTTEIYISHRGMVEVAEPTISTERYVWQPRPPDPELEADMLRRLMVRLGVDEGRAQQQVASAQQMPPRAQLGTGKYGVSSLEVNESFDRAWRRVGLALDRVGFTVEDRDRSKGLYFVRYVDPDADLKDTQKKGFFEKLNPFSSSSAKARPEQYQIQLEEASAGTEVNVLNKDGKPEGTDVGKRILKLLYEQLK